MNERVNSLLFTTDYILTKHYRGASEQSDWEQDYENKVS